MEYITAVMELSSWQSFSRSGSLARPNSTPTLQCIQQPRHAHRHLRRHPQNVGQTNVFDLSELPSSEEHPAANQSYDGRDDAEAGELSRRSRLVPVIHPHLGGLGPDVRGADLLELHPHVSGAAGLLSRNDE